MSRKNKVDNKYAHPYHLWEDYLNGMFNDDIRYEKVQSAISILGEPERCRNAMNRVVTEWKYATQTNLLSDVKFRFSSNRSWLGAACCNIQDGCTISEVRNAWWLLTEEQRDVANEIADEIIAEYKNKFFK